MIGSVTGLQQDMAEIGKRRRKRRDQAAEVPAALTDSHEIAAAGEDAAEDMPDGDGKAVHTGPDPAMPAQAGEIAARDYRRGPLTDGHAAQSPMSGPPCGYPVPEGQSGPDAPGRPYIGAGHAAASPANTGMPPRVVPAGLAVTHGAGPMAAAIAQHQGAAGLVMTSHPPHGGQ